MEMKNFEVGDWVFCEFKLQQIKEMTDGRIVSVSDGHFTMGSFNLNNWCVPMTTMNKLISEEYQYWQNKLHEIKININHPDIHRTLIMWWVDCCKQSEDTAVVQENYNKLRNFCEEIFKAVEEMQNKQIFDVKIFGR